ncbi:MAG: CpsD/CapB family tyrosine-protein kinase [Terriglobales bacterium]
MSRNFELLNQIGKGPVVLQPEVEPNIVQSAEVYPPLPALEIDGMAREEVSKLVHRLFFLAGDEAPHCVVFTGTESGNGSTWMCVHAGAILASQVARSVCLVDCNLRSPALHKQLGVENQDGLGEALRGNDPIRRYAQQMSPNFWLVSGGASNDSAQEMLTSDRMRMRISELRSEFDYILLDVASLNTCNHATVLGSMTDGVALVLKAHSSRRDSASETIQELQASNVHVLGAVLNQRTFPIPERIYNRL